MAALLVAILFIMSYRDSNEDSTEDFITGLKREVWERGQGRTPVTFNFFTIVNKST